MSEFPCYIKFGHPCVYLTYRGGWEARQGGCAERNLCRARSVAANHRRDCAFLISVHPALLLGGRRVSFACASYLKSRDFAAARNGHACLRNSRQHAPNIFTASRSLDSTLVNFISEYISPFLKEKMTASLRFPFLQ